MEVEDWSFFWFEDDVTGANLSGWVKAAHDLVVAYVAKTHGDPDLFASSAGHPIAGRRDPGGPAHQEQICDGKRFGGGTLDRFFVAHQNLSDWLANPTTCSPGNLAVLAVGYGRYMTDLVMLAPDHFSSLRPHNEAAVDAAGRFRHDLIEQIDNEASAFSIALQGGLN